jgi:hypothetical protein
MKFGLLVNRISALLLSSLLIVSPVLFSFPSSAFATTCGFGSDIGGGQCQGFLTSSTSWTVPSDWNSSNNTIEVIGGGSGGAGAFDLSWAASGGGGGGYSKSVNVTLTTGATVTYQVGAGGSGGADANPSSGGVGGDTYLCNSTSNCASLTGTAVVAGAQGGQSPTTNPQLAGAGGASASGVASGTGSVKYSGGSGTLMNSNPYGAGGGGGAAGPFGNGGAAGGPGIILITAARVEVVQAEERQARLQPAMAMMAEMEATMTPEPGVARVEFQVPRQMQAQAPHQAGTVRVVGAAVDR